MKRRTVESISVDALLLNGFTIIKCLCLFIQLLHRPPLTVHTYPKSSTIITVVSFKVQKSFFKIIIRNME